MEHKYRTRAKGIKKHRAHHLNREMLLGPRFIVSGLIQLDLVTIEELRL